MINTLITSQTFQKMVKGSSFPATGHLRYKLSQDITFNLAELDIATGK
jgi:hypothetical protein